MVVTMAKNGRVLAGNNEDYFEPRTKIWFCPGTPDTYGRVYVGYDRYFSRFQGGMNDQGLFMDMLAVNTMGWQSDPDKQIPPRGDGVEHILSHFATVDEVIDWFRAFNQPALDHITIPVADAQGNSVLIEWGKGQVQFVSKKGSYQIGTNFVQSDYDDPEDYPCVRYEMADLILRNAKEVGVDVIRSILSATHQEHYGQTLYSNICDLIEKKIYLYHFHNFEEAVVFDLEEELAKGGTAYPIPSLFATQTYAAHQYELHGPQIGAKDLLSLIDEKGIQEGMDQFHEMRSQSQTLPRYIFDEEVLSDLGYTFAARDRMDEAIEIFQLNVELHPQSWKAYTDTGDAYRKKGDKEMAIRHYEKARELNPENAGIAEKLRRFKEED